MEQDSGIQMMNVKYVLVSLGLLFVILRTVHLSRVATLKGSAVSAALSVQSV